MLLLQKLISNLFLSPMLLILILLGFSFIIYKKNFKQSTISKILIIIASTLYIFSIEPIKDMIVRPLEKIYKPIDQKGLEEGDVYVVLGGGSYDKAPLSFGMNGIPTETALARIVEAVRLYRISPKKVIVSGGIVWNSERSEAEIYKDMMVDLGIMEKDIIIEGRSRTTSENARYTSEIMEEMGYEKAILITSATHMNRGVKSFERNEVEVIPAPCNYTVRYNSYGINAFMPRVSNIDLLIRALWEYVGYIYYALRGI